MKDVDTQLSVPYSYAWGKHAQGQPVAPARGIAQGQATCEFLSKA